MSAESSLLWPETGGAIGLVSASPRRAELLKQIDASFRVIHPRDVDEEPGGEEPEEMVRRLAREKALSVGDEGSEKILLAADTVVVMSGKILGKPSDEEDAARMLSLLSGSGHRVITGVCVVHREEKRLVVGEETTHVFFRSISTGEIERYVATGEPMDKAGGYGIQGVGALLVERIEGCYFNVVGLPLVRARRLLVEVSRTD